MVFQLLTSLATVSEVQQAVDRHTLLIKNAQEMILSRLEGDISVTNIAKELKLSREHFSRLFRKETGLTPAEYILREKMLYAARLLKEGMLSCKEIADRLGYVNATNFTRAFKQSFYLTPKEFRIKGGIPSLME